MAIELWAAVDGDGLPYLYSSEPELNDSSGRFLAINGYLGGKIASIACRHLHAGQKAVVKRIDIDSEAVEIEHPAALMGKLVASLSGFFKGEVTKDQLEGVLREVESQ